MARVRMRLTLQEFEFEGRLNYLINAEVVKSGKHGIIDEKFLTERHMKELREFGYVYVLQYEHRIC